MTEKKQSKKEKIIGIDLGTSNSACAVLQAGKSGGGVSTDPIVADGIFYVLNEDAEIVAFEGQRDLTSEEVARTPVTVDSNGVIDGTREPGNGFLWFGN